MSVRVNLLPATFVRRRRERRRRRIWAITCAALLISQAVAALLIHERGRVVARYRREAARLRDSFKQEKAEHDALEAKARLIVRDTELAERLREKHYWSRWLGNLSLMVPERVVLTSIETEPASFDSSQAAANAGSGGKPPPDTGGVRTVRLRGATSEYGDLMALYKQMNGLKWFRSVQLEEWKRQKTADRDAIGFALACDW